MEIKKQILKESKENLPLTVLTELAAQSWAQVGAINDQIKVYKNQKGNAVAVARRDRKESWFRQRNVMSLLQRR